MLTLHHGSGPQARKDSQARHGRRPTEYLESIGVLGNECAASRIRWGWTMPRSTAWRAPERRWRCVPVTAAKGARGVPEYGRMPELLAKGVKIALGSDSPNNSNHLDIVRSMNMAAIQYKDARQDMRQIPAETALEMATRSARRGARRRRRARLDRAGQEGRPGALRHPAAGVAGALEPGQQSRLQRRRAQRAHGDHRRPGGGRRLPSVVRRRGRRSSPRCRRSENGSRPGPASRSRARAGRSSDRGRAQRRVHLTHPSP